MTDQLIAIFVIGGLTAIQAMFFKPMIANILGWAQIRFKKPFRKGDFVNTNGFEGIVIGIKFDGVTLMQKDNSTVVLPCSTITSSPLVNKSSSNLRPASVEFVITPTTRRIRVLNHLYKIEDVIRKAPMWLKGRAKVKGFSGAGIQINVRAYHDKTKSEKGYLRDRDFLFACLNDLFEAEDWPPMDINVAMKSVVTAESAADLAETVKPKRPKTKG